MNEEINDRDRASQPVRLMRAGSSRGSLEPRVADVLKRSGARMLSPAQAALYRRLTLGDDALMASLFSDARRESDVLDPRTSSLIRLAALIAIDADIPAYQREVRDAIASGVSPEQITGVLMVITRVAGSALVMSAAPKLALAMGYDVDAGLEDTETSERDA
jgi:alkylhydroperoxidase/carboxymuconolactone decarboxylase family protein YurZ